jgi:putative PEP-CTERM system TPR-repeat lipoprotein
MSVGRLLLTALVIAVLGGCTPRRTADEHLRAAEQLLAQGDARGAEIELRSAVQLAPTSGPALRLRGVARLALRQGGAAEADLRKALERGEAADTVLPALARALALQGRSDALVKEFDTLPELAKPGDEADVRAFVGDARLSRGETDAARAAYRRALVAVPGHVPARLGLARLDAAEGRLDAAAAEIEALLVASPDDAELHFAKGQVAALRGDRASARAALERAIVLLPQHVVARTQLVGLLVADGQDAAAEALLSGAAEALVAAEPRLIVLRASLEMRRGALDAARARVGKLLEVQPEHVAGRLTAGEIEWRAGRMAEAETHLLVAAGKARQLPAARQLLAMTYLRQQRPAKAAEALQPLLTGERIEVRTLLLAGEAALANGDLRRAAAYFEQARAGGGGDDPRAGYRLGQIAIASGDLEAGERALASASAADRDFAEADTALVLHHLQRQESAKAQAAARILIEKRPQSASALALAGWAALGANDRDAARRHFDAALALRPAQPSALRGHAELDLAEGRAADAVRRYEALIAQQPDETLVLALADLQRRGAGGEAAALETLRRAVKAQPDAPQLLAALVEQLLRRGETEAALTLVQKAVSAHPRQPAYVDILAGAQLHAGREDDALRTLGELAELMPDAPQPLVRKAALQVRRHDYAGAVESLNRARRSAPDDLTVLSDLARAQAAAGRHETAIDLARTVQSKAPDRGLGSVLLGDIHAAGRDLPEAERAYRLALKAEPDSAAAATKLHALYLESGRGADAAALATSWFAAHPNDTALRLQIADRAAAAGRLKEAAQLYERILARDAAHVAATNNLAWVLGELNDPRALALARRAAALAPANPDVLDTLGVLLLREGDVARGVETLAAARALAPERPDLRLHLARGLLKAERTEEAKVELIALRDGGEFPGQAEAVALLASLDAR